MDELTQKVAAMRKLGVISWDGVVLGPEPAPKVKLDAKNDPLASRREYYETLLGRGVDDKELGQLP